MARGICVYLLVFLFTLTIAYNYPDYKGYHKGYHGGPIHAIKVGGVFRRYRRFGVRLIGHGILFNKYYYGRRCGINKLYGALSACYDNYGTIRNCFPVLYKKGLIGKRHIYHRYGKGYGLGVTFVKRGIVYGKSYYKFRVRRRQFIRYMTSCYSTYRKPNVCVTQLTKQGLISAAHPYHGHVTVAHKQVTTTVHHAYRGYTGFKIVHNRFVYKGHPYKLSCSKRRFYSVWKRCYGRYHSRSLCFGRLRKHHLFVDYSKGYNGDYVYDKGLGYADNIGYDSGFKIIHGRFSYHGKAYKLSCSSSRFYSVWKGCYNQYHSRSVCFNRLYKQHVFVPYVTDYGTGYDYDYDGFGFKVVGGRFSYHGKVYRLSCSKARFYSLWKGCWGEYHDRGLCFDQLYKQHLFAPYVIGGGFGYDYPGFKIVGGRFSYKGIAYKLSCGSSRFYSVWNDCWNEYHSRGLCFNRLYKQHLFVPFVAGYLKKHLYLHKKIANQHIRTVNSIAKNHVGKIHRVAKGHIYTINRVANKHVAKVSSVANHHIRRFLNIANAHINKLHKQTKYHLSAVEKQHYRHQAERQYQHKSHIIHKELVDLNHEHAAKKIHSYAKYDGDYYGYPLRKAVVSKGYY